MAQGARRSRWRGWLRRTVIIVALLALVLRVSLGLWLPPLLVEVAEQQGWHCSYETLELSLSTVQWQLGHLQLDPLQGTGPSLHIEFADADLSVWDLLFGELVVRRLEIDGLDLALVRNAEGLIVLPPAAFADGEAGNVIAVAAETAVTDDDTTDNDTAATPADSSPADPPSLLSPLRLDALRLQNVQIDWRDETLDPPLSTRLDVDLRVSDLGSTERPVRIALTIAARGLVDRLHLEISATSTASDAQAALSLRLGGLDLSPAADLLAPLGLSQVGGPLHCDLVGDLSLSTDSSRPALSVSLRQLSLGNGTDSDITSDELSLIIPAWGADLTLGDVTLRGLHAGASREADGSLLLAGLRLSPVADDGSDEQRPDDDGSPGASGGLIIERLQLLGETLSWRDLSVHPAVQVNLALEELTINDLMLGTSVTRPARLQGRLSAPGVFATLDLSGAVQPRRHGGTLQLAMSIDGLAPDALQGYLAPAGVAQHMVDGQMRLEVDGSWSRGLDGGLRIAGSLGKLTLQSGGETLSLGELSLEGCQVSADGGQMDIGSVGLSGLGATLAWDDQGLLQLPGLTLGVPVTSTAPSQPAGSSGVNGATAANATADGTTSADGTTIADGTMTGSDPSAHGSAGTVITVGRVNVDGSGLTLAPAGMAALTFQTLRWTAEGLRLAEGPPTVDKIQLLLSLPGVVERLDLSGRVGRRGKASVVDLDLSASGLDASLVAELVAERSARSGLLPNLQQGELSATLQLQAESGPAGLVASLRLDDLSLSDRGTEVLALEHLAMNDLLLSSGDVSLGQLLIEGPFVRISRDQAGALALPGLLIPAPAAGAGDGDGGAVEGASAVVVSSAAAATVEAPPTPELATAPAATIHLGALTLSGGRVLFSDEGLVPSAAAPSSGYPGPAAEPLLTELQFGLDLGELELSEHPEPAELSLRLSLPGSVEELELFGQLRASPLSPRAELSLRGSGVTLAGLSPYLPPGVRPTLEDGRLSLELRAAVDEHVDGGQVLALSLDEVSFRDGDEGPMLWAWDDLSLSAARIDPAARVFAIDDLRWVGLRGIASRDESGALHASGFVLAPVPTSAATTSVESGAGVEVASEVASEDRAEADAATAAAIAAESDADEVATAADDHVDADAGDSDAAAVERASVVASRALPTRLRLQHFELAVERFDWSDAGREPLALDGLTLANRGPIVLEAESGSAPFQLELRGALPPLVGQFGLDATLDPFAIEPQLSADVFLTGLDGSALGRLAPETFDGAGLADGRFAAHFDGAWLGRRRGPLDYSVSNGVPLELALTELTFRDGVDGEILLGLGALRAEVDRALGDPGDTLLRSLEIERPVARIERNERGLELGHLLLLTAAAEDTVVAAAAGAALTDVPQSASVSGESEVAGQSPEFAVKSLLVSGLDVDFRDLTVEPPLVLPLTGLDLDLTDFSTRVLSEPRQLSASLYLRGGPPDIELVSGRAPRPIFEEISLVGRWSLFPVLSGRTRVQLDGVDLVSFRGPAAASRVVIDDGVLDARIDLDFEDDGDLSTDARFLFSDLDIDEPADGPIGRFLKLPSALSGVLFVLRDEDGVVEVPLSLDVAADGLSLAEVTRVAVTTLGGLITSAIANTPFRVVGGITDGVGSLIGFEGEDVAPGDPVELPFVPGELWLRPDELGGLATLRQRLSDEHALIVTLRHEMGRDDQLLLGERANPPAPWVAQLAGRLRAHKSRLNEERALVAERLEAELTAGLSRAARSSTRQLADLDERIGLAEQGLDELLEMLRPGSERLAGRRTRTLCLSIASLRLERLAATLRQLLPPPAHDRVRVLAPRWNAEPERGSAVVVITPALRKGE